MTGGSTMTKLHSKALGSALAFFVALFTGSWTRLLLHAAPAGLAAPQNQVQQETQDQQEKESRESQEEENQKEEQEKAQRNQHRDIEVDQADDLADVNNAWQSD